MQHWHKKLPVLGKAAPRSHLVSHAISPWHVLHAMLHAQVAVMLTTYPGSAEVEQNFSLVEMFTAKRQAKTTAEHMRTHSTRFPSRLLEFRDVQDFRSFKA